MAPLAPQVALSEKAGTPGDPTSCFNPKDVCGDVECYFGDVS